MWDTRDIEFNPANGRLYISGYHWGKPVNAGTYISGALISVDVAGAPERHGQHPRGADSAPARPEQRNLGRPA
jgi:hypothetical protein